MEKRVINLVSDKQKSHAKECIDLAPEDFVCVLQQRTRSLDQNALLHKVLSDIASQVIWQGHKLPVDVWKRLCVAAWLRERGEQPTMIPALDGKGFDVIFERTSRLRVSECAELVEWCMAFGSEQGVEWSYHDRFTCERERLKEKVA